LKEVGLTVGGFYKHFDCRDDLVIEALRSAFGTWRRQSDAAASVLYGMGEAPNFKQRCSEGKSILVQKLTFIREKVREH
jgi:AcrR family transcriptional regulator